MLKRRGTEIISPVEYHGNIILALDKLAAPAILSVAARRRIAFAFILGAATFTTYRPLNFAASIARVIGREMLVGIAQ